MEGIEKCNVNERHMEEFHGIHWKDSRNGPGSLSLFSMWWNAVWFRFGKWHLWNTRMKRQGLLTLKNKPFYELFVRDWELEVWRLNPSWREAHTSLQARTASSRMHLASQRGSDNILSLSASTQRLSAICAWKKKIFGCCWLMYS